MRANNPPDEGPSPQDQPHGSDQPPQYEGTPYYSSSGPYGSHGFSGSSPYAQQPPPPPLPDSSSRWGTTSVGVNPAIEAGLAYLFGGHGVGIVAIILLLVERQNRFARFHAVQALLMTAAFLVGLVACGILFVLGLLLSGASDTAGHLLEILSVALIVILLLSLLVFDIWGIIAGFSARYVEFPVIGPLAARLVGGPPMPLY